jgi:hypothetical protein
MLQYALKPYGEYSEIEICSALDALAISRKINVNFMIYISMPACSPRSSVRHFLFPFKHLSAKHTSIPAGRDLEKSVGRKSWLKSNRNKSSVHENVRKLFFTGSFLSLREVPEEPCRKMSQNIISV